MQAEKPKENEKAKKGRKKSSQNFSGSLVRPSAAGTVVDRRPLVDTRPFHKQSAFAPVPREHINVAEVPITMYDSDEKELWDAMNQCWKERDAKRAAEEQKKQNSKKAKDAHPTIEYCTQDSAGDDPPPPPGGAGAVAFQNPDKYKTPPSQPPTPAELSAPRPARRLATTLFYDNTLNYDEYHNSASTVPRPGSCPPALPSPTKEATAGFLAPKTGTKVAGKRTSTGLVSNSVAKKKKAPTKRQANNNGGGMRFTAEEDTALLDAWELILPIGKEEHAKAAAEYNNHFPSHRHRETQNLRAKFNKWMSSKAPTGDPDLPPTIRRAKQIAWKIKEKAQMVALQDGITDPFEKTVASSAPSSGEKTDNSKAVSVTKATRKAARKNEFVKAIKASDKAQAKRDKRREMMNMQGMMVMATTVAAIASALSGKKVEIPNMTQPASMPMGAGISSDDTSTSSDDSSIGGGSRFKKRLAAYKKKRALKKKKKKKKKETLLDSDQEDGKMPAKKDDDDSSSGGEVELVDPYGPTGKL
ncbi:unknown protein [Seminavis robusta]|uniref:DUF6818 domain-containing protein n=1 Tax=Seminavis robusta TaxID=568900 RepID=A0A9N8HD61_9STRA|nr:unknown protein [Seminavis robusta]|eukprot:Sro347_g122940.1 n/a (529) ;mRNA; r:32060-33646